MRRKQLGLLIAAAITLAACGGSGSGIQIPTDPDAPVLQMRIEGGFAPVEWILGSGPMYTLLADGRLISKGAVPAIYPGPLLPNYQVSQVNDQDMTEILDLVAEIGLPEMTDEVDDTAAQFVADAGTTVATFWDEDGEIHQYSVYALGLDPEEAAPSTAALAELTTALDQAQASSDSLPYEPAGVRVLAGVSGAPIDVDFEDVRPWPLGDDDPADWEQLPLDWACNVYGPEILDDFQDASQVTQWTHPDPMMDAPPYSLLVRPLHPGEDDCVITGP